MSNFLGKAMWQLVASVLLLAQFISTPAQSQGGGDIALKAYTFGGSPAAHIEYALLHRGLLEITVRSPAGKASKPLEVQLSIDENLKFHDLVKPESPLLRSMDQSQSDLVQQSLGYLVDVPFWRIDLYELGALTHTIDVPAKYVGTKVPQLQEIPQVAEAWQLLDMLDRYRKGATKGSQ